MSLPFEMRGAVNGGARDVEPRFAATGESVVAFAETERVAPFEFRSLAGEDVEELIEAAEARSQNELPAGVATVAVRNCAARETALRKAVDAARQEGLQAGEKEGRRATRAEMEGEIRAAVVQERRRLAGAVEQFHAARERYFAEVEQEVVKLSLAIAARVLHREAMMDPLLLTGAVRVALEKMAERTGVVVRVAPVDVAAWEAAFASMEMPESPRVTGDAELERGDCVLETRMGTVALGVAVQLEEIEKGFFDLLQRRPVE